MRKDYLSSIHGVLCDCSGDYGVFLLNQLAVERSNENERIKVFQSLHSELAEIEIYCNERTDNYRDDIDILKALLLEDLNIESLNSLTSSKAKLSL